MNPANYKFEVNLNVSRNCRTLYEEICKSVKLNRF